MVSPAPSTVRGIADGWLADEGRRVLAATLVERIGWPDRDLAGLRSSASLKRISGPIQAGVQPSHPNKREEAE